MLKAAEGLLIELRDVDGKELRSLKEADYARLIHVAIVQGGFGGELLTLKVNDITALLWMLGFSSRYKPCSAVFARIRERMRSMPVIGDCFGIDGAFRDSVEYAAVREKLIRELSDEMGRRIGEHGLR